VLAKRSDYVPKWRKIKGREAPNLRRPAAVRRLPKGVARSLRRLFPVQPAVVGFG
jgi:hypothetical protein